MMALRSLIIYPMITFFGDMRTDRCDWKADLLFAAKYIINIPQCISGTAEQGTNPMLYGGATFCLQMQEPCSICCIEADKAMQTFKVNAIHTIGAGLTSAPR
jgi:hypothetical protein